MYNPNGGASFGHYASLRIEGKIREYLGNEGLIHIPANIKAERGRYLRVVEGIRKTTGKEPAPEEIATQLEMPLERITRLQEDLRVGHSFTSLDELIEDEGRHAVEEFYAAQNEMLEEEEKNSLKKHSRRMSRDVSPLVMSAYFACITPASSITEFPEQVKSTHLIQSERRWVLREPI